MAQKKIDKYFILSDSSVNVYGFRLLTEGCLLDEVLKNPIGYYGHEKEDGILLRWEDVKLDGDKIVGKPVINMEHPRAERTVKEIEEGFLKAASVGHICLIEHRLEDNPNDPENPILVGVKWYYKECSLVDSPGNRSAFVTTELFDGKEQPLNLSDLTKTFINKNKSDMKEISLKITPALVAALSLSDDADGKDVAKRINDLHDRAVKGDKAVTENADLKKEIKDLKDEKVKAEVSAILDKGLTDKKLTVALKDQLAKTFADNPSELKELVDAMQPYNSVVDAIEKSKSSAQKNVKDLADKSWDELDQSGELQDLKDNDFDTFKLKFKAKFNKEYKG